MAFFSFGQTLKKKFSRSKRVLRNQDISLKQPILTITDSAKGYAISRLFSAQQHLKYGTREQWKDLCENKIQRLGEDSSNSEGEVYEERFEKRDGKATFCQKQATCDVAVGPDVSVRVKEKSTQTKPDTRHKYVDTRDLLTSVQPDSNHLELHHDSNNGPTQSTSNKSATDTFEMFSEESDLLTKFWKNDWLLSLSAKRPTCTDDILSIVGTPTKTEGTPTSTNETPSQSNRVHDFDTNFVLHTFPDLKQNQSLMKRVLTRELFDELKDVTTATNGITIGQVIQQGRSSNITFWRSIYRLMKMSE